jgi:SAM-dependent methyltransferase
MQSNEYQNLAAHERTYWWFVSKRRLVEQCLQQYGPPGPQGRPNLSTSYVLDIGCGTGANLARLRSLAPAAVGFDFSVEALKFAKRRHQGHLGQADVLHLPLADHSLDLITILDVLYHQWISDDRAALAEIYRVLKPGGLLILTDSAFSFLRGSHDVANLGARRYTRPQMRAKLVQLGFDICKESYVYALLFPIAFMRRWLQRTFAPHSPPTSDVQALPAWLNAILLNVFSLELAWLRYGSLPWGTSILFVVRKPGTDLEDER